MDRAKVALTLRVDEARERRDCIDQAWYPVLRDCDFRPVLLPNDADEPDALAERLCADDVRGVILTGGNDLAEAPGGTNLALERDAFEGTLIDACAAADIPLLGVCRGLQKLAVHYGGTLTSAHDHVATTHATKTCPGAPAELAGRDAVNSFHCFGVLERDLGSELRAAAVAPDGTVEALVHERHRQWAIMWHPERAPNDPRDRRIIRSLFGRD